MMSYLKPQSPVKYNGDYLYPLTTADQVVLINGERLEQDGTVVAGKFSDERTISLTGDITGTVAFDGSKNVAIQTSIVSAANYYNATFTASGWSTTEPYTQTIVVNGVKASENPIVDINMSEATLDDGNDLIEAWGLIGRISTSNNSITAYCYGDKPEVDVPVILMVIK